jgi:cellulose synthase/poly-beta-1,6-N-acetylglucosamine synthase-like glycosyltransferase
MGTGMALPWELIHTAPLASGHIVEDLRLGFDLAAAGAPPLFCPRALVTSVFPIHVQGAADQRARWEQGHVGVILHVAPRALWRSLVERRPGLAAMALDICGPPLAMFVLLLVGQAVVDAIVFASGGARTPFWLGFAALAISMLAVLIAWMRFGRRVLSLGELMGAPFTRRCRSMRASCGAESASGCARDGTGTVSESRDHLAVLDGWRGISILLVLGAHLLPLSPKTGTSTRWPVRWAWRCSSPCRAS